MADDILLSGAELPEAFREGWALLLLSPGRKAHRWKRIDRNLAERLCDGTRHVARLGNGQLRLFGPGNFGQCRNCAKRQT